MRYLKFFIIYFIIILSLIQLYDYQTIENIVFHYPWIDFRYLLFILIQFYWSTILFDIVYQYICLYDFMRIRVSHFQCISILLKKGFGYCCFYIVTHLLIFVFFFQQYSTSLILLNIGIQLISFVFALFFKKGWNYSYIFINSIILFIHFIV